MPQRLWRTSLRQITRAPLYSISIILLISLGIGLGAAVYGIMDGVLLQPLPYHKPNELVIITGAVVTRPNLESWNQRMGALKDLAAVDLAGTRMLSGENGVTRISAASASANFFGLLGVELPLGRPFTNEEDKPGGPPVIIVSNRFWQRYISPYQTVPGPSVTLDSKLHTIVGVLPPQFQFEKYRNRDIWFPIEQEQTNRVMGVARLDDTNSLNWTSGEMRRLAIESMPVNSPLRKYAFFMRTLSDSLLSDLRPTVYLAMGATVSLLIISWIGIAGIVLSRLIGKLPELSIRAALGATPRHIGTELMAETGFLVIAGGTMGYVQSIWVRDLLLSVYPVNLPGFTPENSGTVQLAICFVLALAIFASLGFLPALALPRLKLEGLLRSARHAALGNRLTGRLRSVGVTVQLATALTLVAASLFMLQALVQLLPTHPGFETGNKWVFRVDLPDGKYGSEFEQVEIFDRVAAALSRIPGTLSVTAINHLPFTGAAALKATTRPGGTPDADLERWPRFNVVGNSYFSAMKIPIRRGRGFTPEDFSSNARVVVIDEVLARRLFQTIDARGERIQIEIAKDTNETFTIVGVASSVRTSGTSSESPAAIYVPLSQVGGAGMDFVIDVVSTRRGMEEGIRRALGNIDSDIPLSSVQPLGDLLAHSVRPLRLRAELVSLVAVFSLLLAVAGVTASFTEYVTQKSAEFSLRIAIGAQPRNIVTLAVGRISKMILPGIALGCLGGYSALSYLTDILGKSFEPSVAPVAGAALVMIVSCIAAAYKPLKDVLRLNPYAGLRTL